VLIYVICVNTVDIHEAVEEVMLFLIKSQNRCILKVGFVLYHDWCQCSHSIVE